jgi:creatinine amidohydrolase
MPTLDPFDLPSDQLRDLFARGAPVYVPVNPVEYHGPHLSLHNDHLIAVALARRLHEILDPDLPLLLTRDLEVGVAPAPGPGSRHLPYTTVAQVIRETATRLADLGARTVIWSTFHGSPLHAWALHEGTTLLHERGVVAVDPFLLVIERGIHPDPDDHAAALATLSPSDRALVEPVLPFDLHAGFFETSVALALAPGSVSPNLREVPPCPPLKPHPPLAAAARVARNLGRAELAAELEFAARGAAWQHLKPHPGYSGMPHLANAEAGEHYAGAMVQRYADIVRTAQAGGVIPTPRFGWLRALTLNGRMEVAG